MSESLKQIGPLYKAAALDTPGDLITKRIEGSRVALKSIGLPQAIQLVKLAFAMPVDSEIDWLLEPIRRADPTFVPESTDRELSLLATGLLLSVLVDRHKSALPAALAYVCCSMGGLRQLDPDGGVSEQAVLALQTKQQESSATLPPTLKLKRVEAIMAKKIQTAGDENNVSALADALRTTPVAVGALRGNVQMLRTSLERLIVYIAEQNDQMQQQWWLFGGWSTGAKRSFRDLTIPEASLRAGAELAELTHLPAGPLSVPGILDKLLTDAGLDPETAVSIADAVEATDLEWRKQWIHKLSGTPVSPLCPVILAASLAVESVDQSDWRQRFERESSLPASTEIPARGLAEQVLREQLLIRLWQSK